MSRIPRINSAGNANVDTPAEILTRADDYTVTGSIDVDDYASRAITYYTSNLNIGWSVTTPWPGQNLQKSNYVHMLRTRRARFEDGVPQKMGCRY